MPLPRPRLRPGRLRPATLARLAEYRCGFRWLRDDIDEAVQLGCDEARATGGNLDALVLQAVTETIAELADPVVAGQALPPSLAGVTPGQSRRFDRDALIALAVRHRFPARRLARIFGLSKTRVAQIAATFPHRTEPEPDHESDP